MEFDLNILRSIVTVVSFIMFVGILHWTWFKRGAADFTEAANLPFEQD